MTFLALTSSKNNCSGRSQMSEGHNYESFDCGYFCLFNGTFCDRIYRSNPVRTRVTLSKMCGCWSKHF